MAKTIENIDLNDERLDEIAEINKMDVFDLSDRFVDVCFETIGNLKEEMAKAYRILKGFQTKMAKEFEEVKDQMSDRNRSIFKYKKFDQEKSLKKLDEALLKVDRVLTEDFNLLKFMGILKVEEALIVRAKEGREDE